MKTVSKIMCCVIAAVIFFYLMLWDYPHFAESLDPAAMERTETDKSEEQENKNNAEQTMDGENLQAENGSKDLKAQLEDIEKEISELKKQQAGTGCRVHLYFDQIFESAYEELYPMMKEKGYTGTLVLTDGQLPGDRLQMTEAQISEMMDDGWELAIGSSEEIDMSGSPESVAYNWGMYVKEYMKDIKTRLNVVPTTYCFNEGEYREEFDEILKEYGFKTIRYFGEEELENKENGLTRIKGCRVVQDEPVADILKEISGYSEVALSTRRVADEIKTPSPDMKMGTYKKLLDSIETQDGLYVAGSEQEQAAKDNQEQLAEQIKELQAQKKEIEKQMETE